MDWLLNNPIANMYDPGFLLLYGNIIILTLAACWWTLRQRDPTVSRLVPLVPSDPDPYEIAYLRGGENEVTRVVIIGLTQRGYLQATERKERLPKHPDPRHLSHLERLVFDRCSSPATEEEIFQSVKGVCAPFEQRLHSERLLMPPEMQIVALKVGLAGALVILGLGGYKLWVALATGHSNVGFLLVMGIASLVGLYYVCRPPRLSSRGRAYLQRLESAFEGLKGRASAGNFAATDPTLLLLVGIFGVKMLAGTPYAYYQEIFTPRWSWGGGGVGGVPGGVWVGGCGGGCGGGGCGGCGGGG